MLARKLLVSACAVLFATVSHAEESIEEITVTGSYIRGTPEDAPSPVQTMQRQEIVTSGVASFSP